MTADTCIYCGAPGDVCAPIGWLCIGCWDERCSDHVGHAALESVIRDAAEAADDDPAGVIDIVADWLWTHWFADTRDYAEGQDWIIHACRAAKAVNIWREPLKRPLISTARSVEGAVWAALCERAGCECVTCCACGGNELCDECGGEGTHPPVVDVIADEQRKRKPKRRSARPQHRAGDCGSCHGTGERSAADEDKIHTVQCAACEGTGREEGAA